MEHIIILPNQLFEVNKLIEDNPNAKIFMIEHPLFFTKYKYHKMKLVLHKSTMDFYQDFVKKKYKRKVNYIHFTDYDDNIKNIFTCKVVKMYNMIDHDIFKEFNKLSKKYKSDLLLLDNPNFICSMNDLEEYIKTKNIIKHNSFYIWCRGKYNILLDKNKKPVGGKWSFDVENRDPFPKNFQDTFKFKNNTDKYTKNAIKYVEKHFKDNIGSPNLYLKITFKDIKKSLSDFIKYRLQCFGKFQDAQSKDIIIGCHSLLSPFINLGMLNPIHIIQEVETFYLANKKTIEIGSVEGYIRQLFWREYVMFIYMFKYDDLTDLNYFNNQRNLHDSWYNATTDIPPMDHLINKCIDYGYLHHIERLMFIGNFMLLSEIKPEKVYDWFMIMFIDSYPWVMLPNIYGMSQHSSGPLMMSRPYFSSSNYIDKMSSTFKKKKNIFPKIKLNNNDYEWFEIWDALYYNFINKHKNIFKKNYSTATHVRHLSNMSTEKREQIMTLSKSYFDNY